MTTNTGVATKVGVTTKICPTCGCSLVRLGIADDKAETFTYRGSLYYFCCQGCKDQFVGDPEPFIAELDDLHVCPACLAEKPTAYTVPVVHEGVTIRFCRCTHCKEAFEKDPTYYLDRLAGKTDFKGLFAGLDSSCC